LLRNHWSVSIGMGGHFGPEYTIGEYVLVSTLGDEPVKAFVPCLRSPH
jgi:hypothetical protein